MKNSTPFISLTKKFFENDPVASARSLETMPQDDAIEILKQIPVSVGVEVFHHIHDSAKAALVEHLPKELFRQFISRLSPEEGANVFLNLKKEQRADFLEVLDEAKKHEIQELLSYPEDSAGRIMTTDFIAFHQDIKVKDAIQKVCELANKGYTSSYVYVIDQEGKLIGIMNMRDMMLAKEADLLMSVMRKEVFKVNCFSDREKVANELSARHLFAVPVVDPQDRLLGIIHANRLIDDVQEEASEDLQKMFGASGDERVFSPIPFSIKTRLPWLYVNLVTAFLAAWVVSLFEDIIAKITVLAVYLPVVAGQGGNAGNQSLAVVMRGLVMREIPPNKARALVCKETAVGIVNGVAVGSVTALVTWLWQGNPSLGLVIGLAMIVNMAVAGFAGALIPITMKALRLDPAQCSSIILTTITDVMGFFAFLGFAVIFQDKLIP